MGSPPMGADVVVRWSDGNTYRGNYRGQRQINSRKRGRRRKALIVETATEGHQEKIKVPVKRPNPSPLSNPVPKRSKSNRGQVQHQGSPKSPSITPLMEQLDSVDNTLQLYQKEMEKGLEVHSNLPDIAQQKLLDHLSQKWSIPERLLQPSSSSHTSKLSPFLFVTTSLK